MYRREFQETKPRVGLIGTGWYGKCDLFRLMQVAPIEVVALCDVDKRMLSDAADQVAARQSSKKRPATFADYRQLLKAEKPDIVIVGTPDHWHALQAIAAMDAGADVYCQKPISVDIAEGQAMLAAARKHQRVVQIGTQRRSTPLPFPSGPDEVSERMGGPLHCSRHRSGSTWCQSRRACRSSCARCRSCSARSLASPGGP